MTERERHPLEWSEEFARLAAKLEHFEAALTRGKSAPDPFSGRDVPGKSLRDDLLDRDPSDPLRAPLLAWTDHLLERRLNEVALEQEAFLHAVAEHDPAPPLERRSSIRDSEHALRRVLAASRSALGSRAESAWTEAEHQERFLLVRSGQLVQHRRALRERRREIDERLGKVPLAELPPLASGVESTSDFVHRLALEVLARTDDWVGSLDVRGGCALRAALLGLGAEEGWPARLTAPVVGELIGEHLWLRGVRLGPVEVPRRLSAMSFPLAAERVAFALARAHERRDLPFVVRRHPAEVDRREVAVAIAAYFTTVVFLTRRLGLGRTAAQHSARALGRALALRIRVAAARVVSERAARAGAQAFADRTEELAERLYLDPRDPLLLGPSLQRPSAELLALLLGVERMHAQVERYDEDWPESPRAAEEVRAELSLPPPLVVDGARAERGVSLLGLPSD